MFGEAYNKDLISTIASTASVNTDPMLSGDPGSYFTDTDNVTSDINGTDSPVKEISNSSHLDKYLWMYLSPLIFVIGVVGNILTIAVLRRKKFAGTTTATYLPIVAAADTAVLIFGIIPEWLDYCEFIVFKEIHPWTCKVEKFLFYTSGDTAIWILVAFTFDRFIAVCFPFKKRVVCQPKRALIVCVVIFILAIAKNVHVFWTRGPQYDEDDGELIKTCGRPHPYTYFEYYIRPWIAFSIVMLVPFIIIIVCNTLIIRTLLQAKRLRKEQSQSNSQQSHSDKAFLQTTAMCLSASFAFMAFIAPSLVLLIGSPYWSNDDETNEAYNFAKAINNQLVYVNHSINFFLYCLTGAKFREELVELLRCHKDGSGGNYLSYYNKSYKPKDASRQGSLCSTRITDTGNGEVTITPSHSRKSPSKSPSKKRDKGPGPVQPV